MISCNVSVPSHNGLPTSDIFQIIDQVGRVLEEDSEVPNAILSLGDIEPTPIGPGGVQVVDEVPVTENPWHEDEALIDILCPLLSTKRKLNCTEKENPSKRHQIPIPSELGENRVPAADACSDNKRGNSQSDEESLNRFRIYQAEQWGDRFEDMIHFQRHRGHCLVPHNFPENPALAQWVKRQRYQYKLKYEGKHSTLTQEREQALEELGFVWDSHRAAWEERFNELVAYLKKHGNCNVPTNYPENRQLSIWVKCQRRQYRLFCDGEKSNMTHERLAKLELLGFVWNPRKRKP